MRKLYSLLLVFHVWATTYSKLLDSINEISELDKSMISELSAKITQTACASKQCYQLQFWIPYSVCFVFVLRHLCLYTSTEYTVVLRHTK